MKKFILILATTFFLTGCYSVFNGGTGGLIVDAESTASPKRGIANVDIYAYTDKATRDSDFKAWKEGTIFAPSNTYYGHTSTDNNGNFTISKIVWKETKPDFGKDADFTTIYLLYYHDNYGLTKDETVITSDSTSDTVYAELTAINKTTSLSINIYDVASANPTNENILVTVTVPQITDTLTKAAPKIYEQTITGNGTINISYPRWKNQTDKAGGKENTPEVQINYFQSADQITWKACEYEPEQNNYAFLADDFKINKTIKNSSYSVSLYGKATRINVPTVNGTYGDTTSSASDGKLIRMKAKAPDGNFSIDCGETTTQAQTIGTSNQQTHGNFSGLGNGFFVIDNTYTDRFTTIEVQFFAEDDSQIGDTKTLRSDTGTYSFKFD
jgi:hypothetical protein